MAWATWNLERPDAGSRHLLAGGIVKHLDGVASGGDRRVLPLAPRRDGVRAVAAQPALLRAGVCWFSFLNAGGGDPQPPAPGDLPRQDAEPRVALPHLLRGALYPASSEHPVAQPRPPPLRRRRAARVGGARAQPLRLAPAQPRALPQRRRAEHVLRRAAVEGGVPARGVRPPVPARERVRLRRDRPAPRPRLLDHAVLRGDPAALWGALHPAHQPHPARRLRHDQRVEPLAQLRGPRLQLDHVQQRLPHHPPQPRRPALVGAR